MRVAGLVAVLVACGGTSTQAPAPEPARPAAPAQPTCDEVGIILRGSVEDRDEGAGPAKEKAIAQSCRSERWSVRVVACVAGTPVPTDCLKQLTAEQKQRYDERIGEWSRQFAPDESVDVPPPPPASCDDAVYSSEYFDPPIDDTSPEQEWELAARKRALLAACNQDGWSDETKACFRDASSASAVSACSVPPNVQARVLALRGLADAIAALRKTPKKLDCAKVVEHHYGDATWRGKLTDKKPAERKKLIADSRKLMLEACKTEGWNESMRACVIADGDDESCFGTQHWDYPYAATTTVPECVEYAAAVADLELCSTVPQATKDALRSAAKTFSQLPPGSVSADTRSTFATSCKAATDAVRQMKSSFGC